MAVMETGAAFFVESDPGPGHLAMAQAWWRQVYSRTTFKQLPLLRLIEWFEHIHPDEGTTRDYRITKDPTIRAAFLKDLPIDLISKPGDGVWFREQLDSKKTAVEGNPNIAGPVVVSEAKCE